jgi:hypothetical protein
MSRHVTRVWFLTALTLAVLLASGCLPEEAAVPSVPPVAPVNRTAQADAPGAWTVLVYMAADNDLEPAALQDLEEMTKAVGTQFLVLVDRSPRYSSADVVGIGDFTDTRLLRIVDGKVSTLGQPGELNMGDPRVLSDFVAGGLEESPSGHHALVLWDHGGAWSGAAWDDSSNKDHLDLDEIASGTRDGLAQAGVERFDLLGFDACLMATYEVATRMAPYATYLVASEEVEPGFGWDWTTIGVPPGGLGTPELARQIIDGFHERAQRDKESTTTLSLLDLTQLERLDGAVNKLAKAVGDNGREVVGRIGWSRGASTSFGRSPDPAQDYFMVDLGDLARQLRAVPALQEAAAGLSDAIEALVVNHRDGPAAAAASGVAGYFPPARKQLKKAWSDATAPRGWQALLDAFYGEAGRVPATSLPRFADPDRYIDDTNVHEDAKGIALGTPVTAGTGGNIAEARLFWGEVDTTDTTKVVFFGRRNAAVNGDKVSATYGWEYLRISDGSTVTPAFADLTLDPDGNVTRISVPITYHRGNGAGDGTLELAVHDGAVAAETFYVETGDGGIAALKPQDGDTFAPMLLHNDMATGTLQWRSVPGGALSADPSGLEYGYSQLPAAKAIMLGLTIVDVAGNSDFAYYGTATPAALGGGG